MMWEQVIHRTLYWHMDTTRDKLKINTPVIVYKYSWYDKYSFCRQLPVWTSQGMNNYIPCSLPFPRPLSKSTFKQNLFQKNDVPFGRNFYHPDTSRMNARWRPYERPYITWDPKTYMACHCRRLWVTKCLGMYAMMWEQVIHRTLYWHMDTTRDKLKINTPVIVYKYSWYDKYSFCRQLPVWTSQGMNNYIPCSLPFPRPLSKSTFKQNLFQKNDVPFGRNFYHPDTSRMNARWRPYERPYITSPYLQNQ